MSDRKPLGDLVYELSRLPGIGEKTARRLSYYILDQEIGDVEKLAQAIVRAKKETKLCEICLDYTDKSPCQICSSPSRDRSLLCVVEEPKDVQAMERSHRYRGLYHVLHGHIVPHRGITPGDIRIRELLERLKKEEVEEVILATNPTTNGETTALYIADLLKDYPVQISRIAYGIPLGGDLEYYDEITIATALDHRVDYKKKSPSNEKEGPK
ncbi:MAG: recombination mediator RecR [Tissierellia bacterium]|nr:recombination mediator RecR [Tissierellia bacterium]